MDGEEYRIKNGSSTGTDPHGQDAPKWLSPEKVVPHSGGSVQGADQGVRMVGGGEELKVAIHWQQGRSWRRMGRGDGSQE